MKLKLFIFSILIVGIMTSCSTEKFSEGQTYQGFQLVEKRFVKEVNADCYYFEHVKSGAKLLKIAAEDPNKTFCVAFKTDPESDAGTPHIMEHSVLNGSKKFPVKSPFDVLVKNSLKTFINAFTGDHLTAYPVASKNLKDYYNLMDVYLDAVYNPLIYTDPNILKQEGWHYELTANDKPVEYRGIVYNEMKGAYSSPTRELGYQVQKNLFPETNYRFSSGGYPPAIPTLTNEMFLDYHRKYYHPSNSHILLYGDADLEKELEFIDKEYLSGFENTNVKVVFPVQKPFDKMKEVTAFYSATEGGSTKDQTYITYNAVAGFNTDQKLVYALNIIADALVNVESAPVRLALQEAGIGKDVNCFNDDLKQNLFQIRVQNANPSDKQKFYDVLTKTLNEVVKNGLDKETVEGIINRLEFNLREGDDAQKGLNYGFQTLNGWFFANDPFVGLEYEKPLAELKKDIPNGYLEGLIKTYLIDNTHTLLLDLQPKPGLEKENVAKAEKELEDYKAGLNKEEIANLVKETEDLIAYQKREDTPEALATVPQLELKDVNPKSEWYAVDKKEVDGVEVLHHNTFTNNVVYVRFTYDLRVLPQEMIPYAALLTELMGSLNTETYSYGDLDKELNKHTGGFDIFLNSYLGNLSDENLIPKFIVQSKAMNNKLNKLYSLASEVVTKTKFDKDRLKDVLNRHQSRTEADVQRNGITYAINRMESYFSNRGMFNELTSGSEYYWFVTNLAKNFDADADAVIEKLNKTVELLFNKDNLVVTATSSKDDLPLFTEGLKTYIVAQPDNKSELKDWKFNFEKKNEGLLTASKVQYVLQGYDFKKIGYEWDGKMLVMNNIISREWLYNRIRVIGGAYGGRAVFGSNGRVFFYSYRDPNLKETLESFDGTPKFLDEFTADEKDMTGFILGTISNIDNPLTPSQQGNTAFTRYFQNVTPEDIQKERDQVLSTKVEDVKSFGKLIKEILDQKAYCVYGSEDKIKENKNLFKELVTLTK